MVAVGFGGLYGWWQYFNAVPEEEYLHLDHFFKAFLLFIVWVVAFIASMVYAQMNSGVSIEEQHKWVSFLNNKCPYCRKKFKRTFGVTKCPHCTAELD